MYFRCELTTVVNWPKHESTVFVATCPLTMPAGILVKMSLPNHEQEILSKVRTNRELRRLGPALSLFLS